MEKEKVNFREEIGRIKFEMGMGMITYDEAKAQAMPYIAQMNEGAKKIAKKYGKKNAVKFSFVQLMR